MRTKPIRCGEWAGCAFTSLMKSFNHLHSISQGLCLAGLLWSIPGGLSDPAWPSQRESERRDLEANCRVVLTNNCVYIAALNLEIYILADPALPQLIGRYPLGDFGHATDVAISGEYAYVAVASDVGQTNELAGVLVLNVHDPSHPQKVGAYPMSCGAARLALSGNYACVLETAREARAGHPTGGFTSPSDNPRSAAADLLILDIRDPAHPVKVGEAASAGQCIATFGNSIYVADGSQLSTFELGQAAQPRLVGTCRLKLAASAIAVSGPHVYVAGRNSFTQGKSSGRFDHLDYCLEIINVSKPTEPKPIGLLNEFRIDPYSISVAGGYAYLANGAGFAVVEVIDPANPRFLSIYGMNDSALWNAYGLAASGNRVYVSAGALKSVDISDPANPRIQHP
jgi:hypothetical protein